MKNTLALATVLLGCSIFAAAQMGSSTGSTPPMSTTPSTFPQDQTGQTPSNSESPSSPSAIPPDTKASGQSTTDSATRAANAQSSTIEGCLSQSSDGGFVLADNAGTNFRLRGDTSDLSSLIGKQVRINGMILSSSSDAGSMASDAGSAGSADSTKQFSVGHVHKVSDNCSSGTPSSH